MIATGRVVEAVQIVQVMNGFGDERIRVQVMVVQMMETGLLWWSCGAIEYPRSVMFHFKVHNGLLCGDRGGDGGLAERRRRVTVSQCRLASTIIDANRILIISN